MRASGGLHATASPSQPSLCSCLLAAGLFSGFVAGNVRNGLTMALALGLPTSASVALWAGGSACIQHMVLRFLLHTDQGIPYNLAQFLNQAVDKTFLRRVGGSYIFMHRLLLEYFALSVTDAGSCIGRLYIPAPQPGNWGPAHVPDNLKGTSYD